MVLRVHVRYLAWWLSWLELRPVTAEVVGSNPIRVVKKKSGSRLLFCVNKNIETEPLKGPKFRKPHTETQKRWNFALCSLRRLLSDLRPKLARAACSNKGLRSDAMLAHKANSNVSAYSVRGFRNFYLIGSVTIIKTVQP